MNFPQMIKDRHEYAKAWKARTGGKVLGYFEETFPEEIAYAAGILPVRILAEAKPDCLSDKWVYGSCFPAKAIINQFMLGEYDYLDGLVNVEGCQWIFNAYEVITNNKPDLFKHYLFSPDYTDSKTSKDVFRSELEVFKGLMEQLSGNTITDEKLDEAIDVYNRNRFLLRRLCELRRADLPKIHGSEFMDLVLVDQVTDKAEMNDLLEKFIEEVEDRAPGRDRIRLMLIGSETWNSELEKLCEDLGADVVIDELDNGTSYFWNTIFPQRDRLMAIAQRYLNRPHNPVKDNNWRRRPEHIFELSEDYHVDGAIIAKQIYCHLHGTDNYMVWKLLRERNIPFHYFERDMYVPKEETELRLEAFLNMVRGGITRLAGWHKEAEI